MTVARDILLDPPYEVVDPWDTDCNYLSLISGELGQDSANADYTWYVDWFMFPSLLGVVVLVLLVRHIKRGVNNGS